MPPRSAIETGVSCQPAGTCKAILLRLFSSKIKNKAFFKLQNGKQNKSIFLLADKTIVGGASVSGTAKADPDPDLGHEHDLDPEHDLALDKNKTLASDPDLA